MEATAIQSVEKNITMVALANVQPSNYNPRKNFDEASLAELSFRNLNYKKGHGNPSSISPPRKKQQIEK